MPTPSRHRYSMEELLGEIPDGWIDLVHDDKRVTYEKLKFPKNQGDAPVSVRRYVGGWRGTRRNNTSIWGYITPEFTTAHAAMASVDDRYDRDVETERNLQEYIRRLRELD